MGPDYSKYSKEPDYSKFTLDELLHASTYIDREKYAERAKRLDEELAQRTTQISEQKLQLDKLPRMSLQFRGSSSEYFRIWIVNLCLSLLTLGIFSAWAKVRKKRYLYSHTILEGTPFQYLGQPIPILKGRLIAVIGFLLYYISSHFFSFLLPYVLLAGMVAAPWVIVRSAAFNARYSAFRNMTFHFSVSGGYVYVMKVPYLLAIIPVLFTVMIIVMMFGWPAKRIVFGIVSIIFAISIPWLIRLFKKFIVEHTSYGGKTGVFSASGGQFFKIYFISGLIIAAIVIPVSILVGALFANMKKMWFVTYLILVPMYAGYVLAYAYLQAKSGNLVWNNTRLGPVRFQSTLRVRDLLELYVTNALGIVISLGLLIPWAVMRTVKYRADNMQVLLEGDLNEFQGSDMSTVAAVGAETLDFFDMDISL